MTRRAVGVAHPSREAGKAQASAVSVTPHPLAFDVDGDVLVEEGELVGNDGRE